MVILDIRMGLLSMLFIGLVLMLRRIVLLWLSGMVGGIGGGLALFVGWRGLLGR